MNKATLRKRYLEKRKALSNQSCHNMSYQIAENALPLIAKDKVVSVFLPIRKFNEVNTWMVVHALKNEKLAITRSDFENSTMQHFVYENNDQLAENEWGIPEPQYGKEVLPTEIDVILIPLLVCDLKGHRLGYGKGFYDRFLAKCKPETLKIGLNFFDPIERIEDCLPTDISLDVCVSPKEVYYFK